MVKKCEDRVRLQPKVPGYPHLLHCGDLAPIVLQVGGKKEVLLWNWRRTDLRAEAEFAVRTLTDLEQLPRNQLLGVAEQLAQNVREQVQQFRDVQPARCQGQGLLEEHLVLLQVRGERVLWDLGCPQNSPELYAQVLCEDLCLHPQEAVHIAAELRQQLRDHQARFAARLNQRLPSNAPAPHALPSLAILQDCLETLPLTARRHRTDFERKAKRAPN